MLDCLDRICWLYQFLVFQFKEKLLETSIKNTNHFKRLFYKKFAKLKLILYTFLEHWLNKYFSI